MRVGTTRGREVLTVIQSRHLLSRGFAALLAMAFAGSASAGEIWLAPQASVPPTPLNRAADFIDMFEPNAPWKEAASPVAVFKLYGSYLARADQSEVDRIVADLKRRHIAIGLETGVMNVGSKNTNPPCGGFGLIEGYGTTALAQRLSQKIKAAGGEIAYIAMDEPLWYGHMFKGRRNGQPACQSSVDDVIALAAPTLSVFRTEFPDAVIGDIEPTVVAEQPGWRNDVLHFAQRFRDVTSRPLAFLHLDIVWARPNEEDYAIDLFRYAEVLKRQGLLDKTGIIYDASALKKDDASWVQDARDHIVSLEDKGIEPDQAIIQSWMPNPTHAMPETSPDTLTSLVNFNARRPR
jgi:hypothetical protein